MGTLAPRCTAVVPNTNAPRPLLRLKRKQLPPSPKNKSVVPRMVVPERSLPLDNQNIIQLFLLERKFKVNGVPMRRCTASACIATSTKLDISGVSVPEHVNDAYFKRAAAPKKTEDGIFEQNEAKYTASEQRKADQKAVDAGVLSALSADKFMKGYL